MVVGHHLIWTAYGWWLPNDPRGSSSHEIRVEAIAELGELHYGRKPVQPASEEIRTFYQQAKQVLAHAILAFTEDDVAIIGGTVDFEFSGFRHLYVPMTSRTSRNMHFR